MKRKRTLTLLEIMIVICLITLITGVIGYNMKGSLDKGKVFRSRQAKDQIHDMLLLLVAEGKDPEKLAKDPIPYIAELNLAKNPAKLMKDGWGADFEISVTRDKKDFKITSANNDKYDEEE